MNKEDISAISEQKKQIFAGDNGVELLSACSLGDGLLKVDEELKNDSKSLFDQFEGAVSFFVPASGSGSRMFKFLHEFSNSNEESKESKEFFAHIKDFAFFNKMPIRVREKVGGTENSSIAQYLLDDSGMGFSAKPKGLIPFHVVNDRVMNPFQTQLVQTSKLIKNNGCLHFTVQAEFEKEIQDSLEVVNDVSTRLEFSYQSKRTDAFCFDVNQDPILKNGEYLRRPAGHGALLENLNAIDSDLILIKNIDNVQPIGADAEDNWKIIGGCLLHFKNELLELSQNFSQDNLQKLNDKYQFLAKEQLNDFVEKDLDILLNRPTRVCGMVKNEGAPGGGPFWVNDNGVVSKQIVEISQVDTSDVQQEIIENSTHFNPVFIAVSSTNSQGKRLDLMDFVDHTKYLKVKKTDKGREVFYRELPGLWNGSMANWNTIFVELPSTVFSPVKSVLDLLRPPHK